MILIFMRIIQLDKYKANLFSGEEFFQPSFRSALMADAKKRLIYHVVDLVVKFVFVKWSSIVITVN